jgi:hypothetical protein
MTHPDDLDSLAPSEPSLLLHKAEIHIADILLAKESLKLVCQEAYSIAGRQRSCRQIARLLKYLYIGLFETAPNSFQTRAIRFMRNRWSRTRIAEHIVVALSPDLEDGQERSTSQDDVDKSILMERFLSQLEEGQEGSEAGGDEEASNSDSDTSSQAHGEEHFRRLREIEAFLQSSPALASMTYRLSRFLLPTRLIELSQKTISIPASQIALVENDTQSWLDQTKLFFQTVTAQGWSWHPLAQPKRALDEDEARVYWTCVSAILFSLSRALLTQALSTVVLGCGPTSRSGICMHTVSCWKIVQLRKRARISAGDVSICLLLVVLAKQLQLMQVTADNLQE